MTTTTRLRTVLAVTFAAQLGLLLWSRTLSPAVLLVAAVVLAAAVAMHWRAPDERGGLALPLAQAALAVALLAAGATTARLEWGARHWSTVASSRERQLTARLEDRVQGVIRRARAATALAAGEGQGAFDALARIRERTAVDAVALLDDRGVAVAWAGDHRGRIPAAVYTAESDVVFPGGTLFDYVYVVRPAGDGHRALAAVLMQAGPPLRGATHSMAERFREVTGERPSFQGAGAEAPDWRLVEDGQVVLTARFAPLSQSEWRGRVSRTGRRVLFGLVLLTVGLLSAVWLRTLRDPRGMGGVVPMAGLSLTLMATPLRRTLGLDRLFSPGWFVLPVPGDFVIEGVMVVLLPLAALLSTVRPPEARRGDLWLRLAVSAALVGGGFAAGAGIMTGSAGVPMLTSAGPLWYVLQPTTVVLLTILAALLIPRGPVSDDRRGLLVWGGAGIVLSLVLALGISATWRPDEPVPTPALFAWAIPFALLARAVAGYAGRGDRLLRWLAAGWLAATAVIPHLWLASQSARLDEARANVASFGARGDPFLTYLLEQFDDEVQGAHARGERGVDLLYEAWVASGLASEPYPVELSLWDAELRREAYLPLGIRLEPDGLGRRDLLRVVERVQATGTPENVPATGGGVSRIMAVPLEGGGAVSVAVAPRASLRPTSALTMFMEGEPQRQVSLDLLPALPFEGGAGTTIEWQKTENGWKAETFLQEGNDTYYAHLELGLAPAGVRLARGVLLITLDLLILSLLWAVGRLARGDPPIPPGGWLGWLGGFRARLIVALFAFFLLPTAVFGWAAYRALAEEVTRAAGQVAERSVVQAASVLPGAGLLETARRTGEDLLYYRQGMLGAASIPEAAELGLYSAWMPPDLYRSIRDGELLGGTYTGELANRGYLVAYRRLRNPGEMLAVPIWLAARDVAVRQREFAHMVIFGVLVGAVLSLALSVLVGRALAEPIGELRRAAAAVGRGQLRARLPEQRADEFGELFASFNRMTRQLRRARAQEIRTARILAWGEMARQVAHEIKNPLTPIKLSVQHIRRAHRDRREDFEPILESNVEQILEEIDRLTEIAKAFSRYGAPEEATGAMEPVDVAAIARDVMTLYRAPDRSVAYRLVVKGRDTIAGARSPEVREVMINLLENARAAVSEGGEVEVRVEDLGPGVRLAVRDDGEGIGEEQLPRIFEPHFSTRSSGTGLGLAIVRRLVESWGGAVGAESEPGEGTVVWLTIPKYAAAPTPEEEADAAG
ncbi:MAG: ATP-binding protein [Candidatus Longimicrobiales bacterium M2_2A_002]